MKNPLARRLKQLESDYQTLEIQAMSSEELIATLEQLEEKYALAHGISTEEACTELTQRYREGR